MLLLQMAEECLECHALVQGGSAIAKLRDLLDLFNCR